MIVLRLLPVKQANDIAGSGCMFSAIFAPAVHSNCLKLIGDVGLFIAQDLILRLRRKASIEIFISDYISRDILHPYLLSSSLKELEERRISSWVPISGVITPLLFIYGLAGIEQPNRNSARQSPRRWVIEPAGAAGIFRLPLRYLK